MFLKISHLAYIGIGRSIHQTEMLVKKAKLLTKDIKAKEDSKMEL